MMNVLLAVLVLLNLLTPPASPLSSMTGEEIHIAFWRNELDVKALFLASDPAYIQTHLDDLYHWYTNPETEYHAWNCEPLPEGATLTEPLTLENCEILAHDTRTQWPIQLKYRAGDYDLYVGLEPWSTELASAAEISQMQWHPNVVYFMPVSADILTPHAQFGDIHIYLQGTDRKYLKAIDYSTGQMIYPGVWIDCWEDVTITANGADRVAVQIGQWRFIVLDFSGEMYYGYAHYRSPYVECHLDMALIGQIEWLDESTLIGETEKGRFRFFVRDRSHSIKSETGENIWIDCPDPLQDWIDAMSD